MYTLITELNVSLDLPMPNQSLSFESPLALVGATTPDIKYECELNIISPSYVLPL